MGSIAQLGSSRGGIVSVEPPALHDELKAFLAHGANVRCGEDGDD